VRWQLKFVRDLQSIHIKFLLAYLETVNSGTTPLRWWSCVSLFDVAVGHDAVHDFKRSEWKN